MATQRPAFAKRDREMKLRDKARAKAERREARRSTPRAGKGPPIEADDAASGAEPAASPDPAADAGPAGAATPGAPAPGQTQ
ncbi:MAG TPA: hypothetical protein VHW23_00560 [Kofleriaceae bacterium]|jgi:hypothetical protein|nr:hypothetical protein [Kofleriaceae bacterium]